MQNGTLVPQDLEPESRTADESLHEDADVLVGEGGVDAETAEDVELGVGPDVVWGFRGHVGCKDDLLVGGRS